MHVHWSNNIGFKPKLRNYTKFKQDINVEYYLLKLTRSQRSLLAQLRIGILPLQIEVGRYYRKKLNERLCLICSDNVIEDECHFLCYSSGYKTEHEKFFLHIKFNLSNLKLLSPNELFIAFMTSESAFLLKFVECILIKRRTFLEN